MMEFKRPTAIEIADAMSIADPPVRDVLRRMAYFADIDKLARPLTLPTIVCLCGSLRFKDEYLRAQRVETYSGRIVLTVAGFERADGIEFNPATKSMLDALHLRKIDLADEILVIDGPVFLCSKCNIEYVRTTQNKSICCDAEIVERRYIGDSTSAEIAYAMKHGKKIRWYSEDYACLY